MSGALGYALLIIFWRGNTSIWESLYVAPGGFGFGVVQSTAFIAIAAGVDDSQMAIASNGMYLSANIGSLVGASVASNILLTSLHRGLSQNLTGFEDWTTVRFE